LDVSVGGDDVRVVLRSANTLTFYGSELDVTLISPASTPGVSDDPVVDTVLGTPTDSGDGVVDLGTAGSTSEDTASVELEGRAASSKSNSNNTLFDTSFVLSNGSWGESRVCGWGDNTTSRLGRIASCLSSSVWILRFKDLGLSLKVVPSPEMPSTGATMRLGVAVNELLLREGEESS